VKSNKDLKIERIDIATDVRPQRKKSAERVMRLGLEIFEHYKRRKGDQKMKVIQTHRAKI